MGIHIVFGDSAMGNLRSSLKAAGSNCDEIIVLQDDLSVGPISNLESFDEKEIRVQWWGNVYTDTENLTAKEAARTMDDSLKIEQIKNKTPSEIYIWIGPCSFEEIGALRLLYHLQNTSHKVNLISFPECKVSNSENYIAKSLGEIPSSQTLGLLKFKKSLTKKEVAKISGLWEKFVKSNLILRIRKGKYIYEEFDKDYYDRAILKSCNNQSQGPGVILNKFFDKVPHRINWDFILWRIRCLVKAGELEYTGDFSATRKFKVRRVH